MMRLSDFLRAPHCGRTPISGALLQMNREINFRLTSNFKENVLARNQAPVHVIVIIIIIIIVMRIDDL
jgi:uncharacterized membrane protein YdcZ (DUF606 family)